MTESATPRLGLPLIAPGQAQKEMYHNEALTRIDLGLHGNIVAAGAEAEPENPAPGQCWILGAEPEGAWAGHPREVAGWTDGGWRFLIPCEGMQFWAGAESGFALFFNGEWRLGETHGRVFVEGEQVVGARVSPIAEPSGGEVVDAEARAAILAVLSAMRVHGLVDTD